MYLQGNEDLKYRSVNQQQLSPQSLKRQAMTRYNRFKNMKNDSTLHDIMSAGALKPPTPHKLDTLNFETKTAGRRESCDVSDNDRSKSRMTSLIQ